MTSTELPIVEVNHGLANRFKGCIEINKHLSKYPNLRKSILEHEYAHTDKEVSFQDFKLDFLMTDAMHYKSLFSFMIRHPKSFTQLLPFYWTRKKGFVYDINMMVMYLTMSCVFGLTIYFGGKYL
jgi:hypothetical protein